MMEPSDVSPNYTYKYLQYIQCIMQPPDVSPNYMYVQPSDVSSNYTYVLLQHIQFINQPPDVAPNNTCVYLQYIQYIRQSPEVSPNYMYNCIYTCSMLSVSGIHQNSDSVASARNPMISKYHTKPIPKKSLKDIKILQNIVLMTTFLTIN